MPCFPLPWNPLCPSKIIPIPKFSSQVSTNKFYPIPNSTQWLYLEGFESNSLFSNNQLPHPQRKRRAQQIQGIKHLTKNKTRYQHLESQSYQSQIPRLQHKTTTSNSQDNYVCTRSQQPYLSRPEKDSTADKQDKDLKAADGCSKIENEDIS